MKLSDFEGEVGPLAVKIDFDILAHQIIQLNYGAERFLAAFVNELRVAKKRPEHKLLADAIEREFDKIM